MHDYIPAAAPVILVIDITETSSAPARFKSPTRAAISGKQRITMEIPSVAFIFIIVDKQKATP